MSEPTREERLALELVKIAHYSPASTVQPVEIARDVLIKAFGSWKYDAVVAALAANAKIKPHIYSPDHQSQGDCRVCGHGPEKPWHKP